MSSSAAWTASANLPSNWSEPAVIKLYNCAPSSASFRVRIALNLKGLPFEYIPVQLTKGGGEQFAPEFKSLNPASLVPVLVDDDQVLTQSLAIIEYLDETRPKPPLLPATAMGRARVRAIALAIACEIHPLNNLRVLRYLHKTVGVSDDEKNAWYRHWVEGGLLAVEAMLSGDSRTGSFCHGELPTLADILLVPQIFKGQGANCDLSRLPTVMRIFDNCLALPAFADAVPEKQAD